MSSGSALSRVEQTQLLDAPASRLASAGGKRLQGLSRLGITSLRDLLSNYPFRYNDLSQIVPIAETSLSERSSILATVKEVKVKRPRPRLLIVEASVVDDSGILIASWFNQPWMEKILTPGIRVILMGKAEHSFGFRRMNSPLYAILEEGAYDGGILPVYRSNSDISQGWVSHCVDDALDLLPAPLDPLPANLRIAYGFMSRHAAWKMIHHPPDQATLREARRRLAFEEVFYLQVFLQLRKKRLQAGINPYRHSVDGKAHAALRDMLPFTLTADQESSLEQILADMQGEQVMNRLLLGDVGSGKTIVAALAAAAVFDSGFQVAMMAPTEVLAEQYAQKVGPLFDGLGIHWALLTSSTKEAARKEYLADLEAGSITALFGTHALIEPDVRFKHLSLVIIDEQHRFGVDQREALRAKGEGCDLLSMTATPIPRSLALTIYGDMDTSYIRTKPHASVKTKTQVINKKDLRFAYESIQRALERGEQAYIVCPLISAPDTAGHGSKQDLPDDNPGDEPEDEIWITEFAQEIDEGHIQAAEQEVSFLRAKVFPERNIGLMTSRLKPNEKKQVMDAFRRGDIDILVSTTVIEVGVDVPNATIMVIEDADHFGLSQLHQLRGRVGRGLQDGEVFLVTATQREDSLKRLSALVKSSDGFKLAEYDLKLRREGDILGSRQHGIATLKLVNVINDAELIGIAHREARKLLECDPTLEQHRHSHLAEEVQILYASDVGRL